jgi:hypothetical protein
MIRLLSFYYSQILNIDLNLVSLVLMRCMGSEHELGSQPNRTRTVVDETIQPIIVILQSKTGKFTWVPDEKRRDAVPAAPEGV